MSGAQVVVVFAGGGTGATCRYLVGRFVGERYDGPFPLGTFLINVSGCFALGLVATLLAGTVAHTLLMALLASGFLGGYTTFSTYLLEGVLLYLEGSRRTALLTLLGSVVAGLVAAAAGAALGRLWGGGLG